MSFIWNKNRKNSDVAIKRGEFNILVVMAAVDKTDVYSIMSALHFAGLRIKFVCLLVNKSLVMLQ
jgi:hypothetical protein